MALELIFIDGLDKGRTVSLEVGEKLLVGRGDDCELSVRDPHVSRVHFRLDVLPEELRLTDSGSSYGTSVNGEQVSEHRLKHDDVIRFGETEIRVLDSTVSASSTLPPTASGRTADRAIDRPSNVGTSDRVVSGNPPAGEVSENLVGTTLQRYQIGSSIAKGQSGMVFRAVDTKNDRDVALKVLWPELAQQQEEIERFIRAIRTVMPIRHPNLVRLYGAGYSDGYCWMAMEYVDGESLANVIDRIGVGGMLQWENALRTTMHVARALEVAFDHKMIHRNITPQNVLVHSEDQVAKLGDLMLAKALEGSLAETITKPGELVGDLAYMAPEQTTGDGNIDCRSDIYNLGATVYRLVTGRLPVQGNNPADTIRKIQTDIPRKPTEFQMSFPPLFEDVILKMLHKNRDERHQTPTKLIRDLERVATYQGITEL